MKRYTVLLLLIVCSIASCKKSNGLDNYSGLLTPPPIPNVPGLSTNYPPIYIYNVWGIMLAITVRGNYMDSTENVDIYSNSASAIFGSAKNSGMIVVNNTVLDTLPETYPLTSFKYINDVYSDNDSLNFGSDDKWTVSGANDIPAISYNYTGSFPSFTGNLSRTLIAANGLSIKFDGSNTDGADSAYIAVCNSSNNYGAPNFGINYSKVVSTNGGTATLENYILQQYTAGIGGTTYLEVFLFKYTIKQFGKKQFAFVKMNETVQNVTIN
jgi:hypothetical protein